MLSFPAATEMFQFAAFALQVQYERAQNLLIEKKVELEKLAHELLAKEVLHKSDLEKLIGPRPYQEEEKFYHPEETKEVVIEEPVVTAEEPN